MAKNEFQINLSISKNDCLEAIPYLKLVNPDQSYHIQNRYRLPLGIYNTSISRVGRRIEKCCQKIETLFGMDPNDHQYDEHYDQVLDYLELALYSTVEHVDDMNAIANKFYTRKSDRRKCKSLQNFRKNLDFHRDFISRIVNAIKHDQARFRMHSVQVKIDFKDYWLHGYFVEGISDGTIGPIQNFHSDKKNVFSITNIIWEMIAFILNMSCALKNYLIEKFDFDHDVECDEGDLFANVVVAAARLPRYTLEDENVMERTNIIINVLDEKSVEQLDSGLYGSIRAPWGNVKTLTKVDEATKYSGDGSTSSFKYFECTSINLHSWA